MTLESVLELIEKPVLLFRILRKNFLLYDLSFKWVRKNLFLIFSNEIILDPFLKLYDEGGRI